MFYSDKPIISNNDDQLHRGGFAKLLANTLMCLDSKDTFTVGLLGKWGCGKTSLVNMTLSEIEKAQSNSEINKPITIVHFEPWNFTDTNQLLTQFFVRLANEFQNKEDENLAKIGKALENYSNAFSLLELIPGIGSPLAKVSKWSASHLGKRMQKELDNRDVLKQKDQVINLLRNQPNRILIVLDDIDRLSNEQIRYVFQLITSVARFPKTTYLLVFDKEIVNEALKDVQSGNGQDYLEKVIQMPIQIPDIQNSDLRNVLLNRLEEIKADFEETSFSSRHWQRVFEVCVEPFINHLRDINRLCNVLRFKLIGISSEIEFTDMIAISVLEIHHPLVFKWVKINKSILTGENDYSTLDTTKSQKNRLEYYSELLQELTHQKHPEAPVDNTTELIINFLSVLFPYFGHKVGKAYEIVDMEQYSRNNQIAHPNKFDRYFQLDIDSIAYKTADVRNIIHHFAESKIIEFLLSQEKKGTSYELLQDIKANIPELSGKRARVLVCALFKSMVHLNQTVNKSLFSLDTGAYAAHMMLDLIERVPDAERFTFISKLISNSDMDTLQSIAPVINRLELGYGRLAANGEEKNYKKVITLEELLEVETVFVVRVKEILKNNSLFDFSEWRMVYHLLNSFDPEYTNNYLQNSFVHDKNILWFLGLFVIIWNSAGKKYEIQKDYTNFFTPEQVLNAIDSCRQNGTFFDFPEELQRKCAAFFLAKSDNPQCNGESHQSDTDIEKLITAWKS